MKRKLLSVLLCTAVTASLMIGCGGNQKSSSTDDSGTIDYDVEGRTYEEVNIQVLSRFDASTGDGKWFNNMVEDFMKEYPGITVETVSIPTESDYLDTEAVAMSDPSSMPNIFQEYGGSRVADYIEAGNIVNLSSYFDEYPEWTDSFKEVGWELTDFAGFGYEGIYGVPWSCYFISLYYNEDILAENNIDPSSIRSWDDLMNACSTLLENGVQPFEMGEKDNYRFGHLHTVLNYKTYGTEVAYELGDDTLSYDSQDELAVYQMIIDAYNAGYLGTNLLGTDDAQEREYFNTGKTAFLFMGSWYCAEASAGENELYNAQKIHTIPFPYVNEEYEFSDMGGANEAFYVTDTGDADEIAASVLFLKYMTSQEKVDELVESYPLLTAVDPTVEVDNYLMQEVQTLMESSKESKGDIENYDEQQHMINTVRNALQGIPSGYTAKEVGDNIVQVSGQYE